MTALDDPSTSATATVTELADAHGWRLLHLATGIGTEVHGIDLSRPLSADELTAVRGILLDRKVVFFRDQAITLDQHMAFCRQFGELDVIPFLKHHPDHPEVLTIRRGAESGKSYENIWHSDVSWREIPSLGSALRAHTVPELGGDTMFSDMEAAYAGLSAPMKRYVEGLTAVHSIEVGLGVYIDRHTMHEMLDRFPPQEHPVVRTHPETGRKSIYVNRSHTSHIRGKGVSREESTKILDFLYHQASRPEYQCRFRWQRDSIAMWDNRACQHYAVFDYFPQQRDMDRVTIVGDRPF